jgi:hypothetical protein
MWIIAPTKDDDRQTHVGYRTLMMKGFNPLRYKPQPLSDAGPLYMAIDQKKNQSIYELEMAMQEQNEETKKQIITKVTGEIYGKSTTCRSE